ncbi:MAG: hypothetical protein V8Q77_05960 [Bacilli bacterium]
MDILSKEVSLGSAIGISLAIAIVLIFIGILFSKYFYNRGKQKVEDKYEKLGKDASKIIDDAEKEGQLKKRNYLEKVKKNLKSLKRHLIKNLLQKKQNFKK